MFRQLLHVCTVEGVVHAYVALHVADYYAFLQAVQGHRCDLVLACVDENLSYVTIQSTPDFQFVPRGSYEA